jgi:hypothetical protein
MLLPHVLSELVIPTVSLPMVLTLGTTVNGAEKENVIDIMDSLAVAGKIRFTPGGRSAVAMATGERDSRASELLWRIGLTWNYLSIWAHLAFDLRPINLSLLVRGILGSDVLESTIIEKIRMPVSKARP